MAGWCEIPTLIQSGKNVCNADLQRALEKKKNENITFAIDSVWSIVFNYWNANLFRPIETFLSLCSLCETLKNILHA